MIIFLISWFLLGFFGGLLSFKTAAAIEGNGGRFDKKEFYENRIGDYIGAVLLSLMGYITFLSGLLMFFMAILIHRYDYPYRNKKVLQ